MSSQASGAVELRSPSEAQGEGWIRSSPDDEPADAQHALPPADRGKDAYLMLVAAFILEALVWGFPFAFGVFEDYYTRTAPFADGDVSSIAAIGTTATGIMYFAAPIVYMALRKFPRWRKQCSIFGFVILVASLIGASFAETVPQLLATQGVLYAIGGAIHYFPLFSYLDEWFVARRAIAYGVVWAGAGASGVAIPLVMQWILREYGFRTALRTWALVEIVLTVPVLAFFIKGRLPERHASMGPQKTELGFLKSGAFWILQIGNISQGLGYFMPSLYLPSFAQAVGLSALTGTIAVSLMNGAYVVGATIIGLITERYHVTTAVNICAIGTIISVFLFWSFATYTPVLFLFALLYGIFAGGYAATWSGVAVPVRKKYPAVETGMIVSLCSAGKGLGAVISGPLSGALVRSDVWKHHAGYAFGSGYGYLIVFSGLTASLSLLGWCGKKCGLV